MVAPQKKLNPNAEAFKPSLKAHKRRAVHGSRTPFDGLPQELQSRCLDHLSNDDCLSLCGVSAATREVTGALAIHDRIFSALSQYKTRFSLLQALSPPMQLRRVDMISTNRQSRRFLCCTEARWERKTMPIVKADKHKLVLVTGADLWVRFGEEEWRKSSLGKAGLQDITGVALTELPDMMWIGFADGQCTLIRFTRQADSKGKFHQVVGKQQRIGSSMRSIDYDCGSRGLLSASKVGYGTSIIQYNDNSMSLAAKVWTAKLLDSSTFAVGTKSRTPLNVFDLSSAGHKKAIWSLSRDKNESCLAVESLAPNLLLTGWFSDHGTSLFDTRLAPMNGAVLRCKHRYDVAAHTAIATVKHGSVHHIYSGSNMDGKLHKFDIRKPSEASSSWSTSLGTDYGMFLHGRGSSGPIYSVIAEFEKVYAATETRLLSIDYAAKPDRGMTTVVFEDYTTSQLGRSYG